MRYLAVLLALSFTGLVVLTNLLQVAGSPPPESYWSRTDADYLRSWNSGDKIKHPDQYYWLALQTNRATEARSVAQAVVPVGTDYDSHYVATLRKAALADIHGAKLSDAVASYGAIYAYDRKMLPDNKRLLGSDLVNYGMAAYLQTMTIADAETRKKSLQTIMETYDRAATYLPKDAVLEQLSLAQNRELAAEALRDRSLISRYKGETEKLRRQLPIQAPLIAR